MPSSAKPPFGHRSPSAPLDETSTATAVGDPPPKSPLHRKGMSPRKLLDAVGLLSDDALDSLEHAIDEGCGRVASDGE